jgi:hypothetical protein
MMLVGSILGLIGSTVPQAIYAMENFTATYGGGSSQPDFMPQLQSLMYLTVWNWLSNSAWLLFSLGLVLVALRRRGLSKRIAELEMLLAARDQDRR